MTAIALLLSALLLIVRPDQAYSGEGQAYKQDIVTHPAEQQQGGQQPPQLRDVADNAAQVEQQQYEEHQQHHHHHSPHPAEQQFQSFLQRHSRHYLTNTTEYAFRREVFAQNLERYRHRSANTTTIADGHTAVFAPDKFADWTDEEFRLLLGARSPSPSDRDRRYTTSLRGASDSCELSPVSCNLPTTGSIPSSFDWRNDPRGVITAVKNQGQCGGCWAFSAVETIEASWVIAGRTLPDSAMSVQQIISCETQESRGCDGGIINSAFRYVLGLSQSASGLETETAFPFKCGEGCAGSGPRCPSIHTPFVTINSTCNCMDMPEEAMRYYVAKYGPLSIKVDADPWNGYSSGIMRYHCSSLQTSGDHAVQIVGYGVDSSSGTALPYWTIRNSWGADWGEQGYIRVFRGANVCGVSNDVNFALS
eukprot:m.9976 g.9976  ORF g.9976 m.9976 type:complete len:421 (+) comp5887_c0_seq1:137-1399(+)